MERDFRPEMTKSRLFRPRQGVGWKARALFSEEMEPQVPPILPSERNRCESPPFVASGNKQSS